MTVDYRAWDDAWYDVELHMQGEVLTVKFCNLDPPVRERFTSSMFRDDADLELFRKKFRRNSSQLQDGECHRVREGMMVCGSLSSIEGDLRFYDAKVLEVKSLQYFSYRLFSVFSLFRVMFSSFRTRRSF
ncbi:hypothetical protein EJ110_NYTH32246 [Nymphaea thermarum]|nr:hypothetical protein EJ110_NYTH32246 [Nymphaea thermarum]